MFARDWGIDMTLSSRGGLLPAPAAPPSGGREVWLLQRKASKPGEGLGKSTGWVHRLELRRRGVRMTAGVTYERIDAEGLHVRIAEKSSVIPADTVVICAGQEPLRELVAPLAARGVSAQLIGGADFATELDAKRAIRQGAELAASL